MVCNPIPVTGFACNRSITLMVDRIDILVCRPIINSSGHHRQECLCHQSPKLFYQNVNELVEIELME